MCWKVFVVLFTVVIVHGSAVSIKSTLRTAVEDAMKLGAEVEQKVKNGLRTVEMLADIAPIVADLPAQMTQEIAEEIGKYEKAKIPKTCPQANEVEQAFAECMTVENLHHATEEQAKCMICNHLTGDYKRCKKPAKKILYFCNLCTQDPENFESDEYSFGYLCKTWCVKTKFNKLHSRERKQHDCESQESQVSILPFNPGHSEVSILPFNPGHSGLPVEDRTADPQIAYQF